MPFRESFNENDSTKDGRSTMAVVGRVFKSGALTIEPDEINSRSLIHERVVSRQYVRTRMTIQLFLVHALFALDKH